MLKTARFLRDGIEVGPFSDDAVLASICESLQSRGPREFNVIFVDRFVQKWDRFPKIFENLLFSFPGPFFNRFSLIFR